MRNRYRSATEKEMNEANSKRAVFDNKCLELKKLLDEDKLYEAHELVMSMVKEEYSENCVDMWALRYFLQIGNGTVSTAFDKLVKEFVEKNTARIYHAKEGDNRMLPPVLTIEESTVFQDIYKRIKKQFPDADKNYILTYMASKTLENIAE